MLVLKLQALDLARRHAGCSDRLLLRSRGLVRLSDLILESHRALWLDVPDDDDPALRVVPELDWEAWGRLGRLWDAAFTVDVCVQQEGDLTGGVGAWEVEGCWAALGAAIGAEDGRARQAAVIAYVVPELVVGEVEVVELAGRVVLLLPLLG